MLHALSPDRASRVLAGFSHGLPRAALATAVLLLSWGLPASAQRLDSTFWSTDRIVSAIAASGNTLYIGGSFSYVGPKTGSGVRLTAMERHLVKAPTPGSVVGVWIPTWKPETTDEAGRFDDESLCYSRVAPVARHLAA